MPLTILVVEDDEGTRLSIQDYLDLEGYSVMTAKDGWEALEVVETTQPQLIVTDISMPRVDGYAFLKSLRQRPAWRLLPVVFLTAHAETRERVRGYQSGCDAYLEKPFELDELGAVVRNLLERSQLIQTALLQYSLANPTPPAASRANPTIPDRYSAAFHPKLHERERNVLDLISEGLSNAQIADRLYLSPRTVEKYVSSLLRKTETANRAELVRFAMDHHLVD
ncbi:MAG: response regulator transcription factor [Cyanobacteria bacterium]|nr:response regulator transcription factor [Cyanobacteriota bacterium]